MSKSTSKHLNTFGEHLLDHIVNDAKVSFDTVNMKFQSWNDHVEKTQKIYQEQEEEYQRKHNQPRNEAQQSYNLYLRQKEEAYNRYINADDTDPNKLNLMKDWLRIYVPETIKKTGTRYDNIFTLSVINQLENFKIMMQDRSDS